MRDPLPRPGVTTTDDHPGAQCRSPAPSAPRPMHLRHNSGFTASLPLHEGNDLELDSTVTDRRPPRDITVC